MDQRFGDEDLALRRDVWSRRDRWIADDDRVAISPSHTNMRLPAPESRGLASATLLHEVSMTSLGLQT